jgi:hypothetical protein
MLSPPFVRMKICPSIVRMSCARALAMARTHATIPANATFHDSREDLFCILGERSLRLEKLARFSFRHPLSDGKSSEVFERLCKVAIALIAFCFVV